MAVDDPILEGRKFILHTPKSGDDKIYLLSATVEESLGEPYTVNVEALSNSFKLKPTELLGKTMTIEMELPETSMGESGKRYFHGLVDAMTYNDRSFGFAHYSFTLKPKLWFMRYRTDCRIFQEVTTPDLIKAIMREDHGLTDIEDKLTKSYRTMEYCVQYRESDFNFVSRMMEQEGIYYFFKHEKEKHTLVLFDDIAQHDTFKGYEKLDYYPMESDYKRDADYIDHWTFSNQVRPGKVALDDYNFKTPSADIESRHSVTNSHTLDSLEVFDYPGDYIDGNEGGFYATVRMEELGQQYERRYGRGNARGLACGHKFKLEKFEDRDDQNKDYVIVTATHSIKVESDWEGSGGGGEDMYSCALQAILNTVPYRPVRKTPKPLIPGIQTAVVTGPSGEEIHTDEYGRVKVQFHWDRYGKKDDKSSCWIRVSQIWAGKNWGAMFIPRIDQEVIVEFLEGDPDRPLITGRVYNDEQKVPYGLPGEKNKSTIKSESTKEGQGHFNEIRFDDTKDAEEVYFHAEKDFNTVIQNNETRKVGFEDKEAGDQTVDIYNNRTVTIDQGNDAITVKKGDRTVDISAGQETHTAAKKITLKVGSSSIVIEPAKISISSGTIDVKGTASITIDAPSTTVKGSATLTLQGGLVKIN